MYSIAVDERQLAIRRQRGPGEFIPQNEVQKYRDARYLTTSEASWRAFGFPMNSLYPQVIRLDLHLEDEQMVCDVSCESFVSLNSFDVVIVHDDK
jgi:hypothetical protein